MNPDDIRRVGTEPEVFEAFYREHIEAVQRFVARRVADPQRAADLTADIFLAVIAGAATYSPAKGPAVGWLFGIARNTVADDGRSRARELRALSRLSGRRHLDPQSLARVEERIDAERAARQLYRMLDDLPARDRALFELIALDGISVADAALVLGVKPVTARVRLHRSRRLIQHHWRAAEPEPPVPAVAVTQEATP